MATREIESVRVAEATAGHREVVGVFHDERALEAAMDDLMECGFDRAEISLLASERAVAEKLGHGYGKVSELEDDHVAARISYAAREDYGAAEGGIISGLVYVGALAGAGAVVASGGALTAILLAAALTGGAGGAVGVGLARWLDLQRTRRVRDQLEKGGLLVWVHASTGEREKRAVDVLQKHGAEDVHAHELGHAAEIAAALPSPPLLTLLEAITPHRHRPHAS
jgi:hypothetical protein